MPASTWETSVISSFAKGQSSPTCCWPTRSTGPRPAHKPHLLEAMNEGQVSIEGHTYLLGPSFFVLATQNPHEYEGTYPLPENQLDRFTICTDIGYPDRAHEMQILESHRTGEMVDHLNAVLTSDQLRQLQSACREVTVHASINSYMLDIIAATARYEELELGVSTRSDRALPKRAMPGHAGKPQVRDSRRRKTAGPPRSWRIASSVEAWSAKGSVTDRGLSSSRSCKRRPFRHKLWQGNRRKISAWGNSARF